MGDASKKVGSEITLRGWIHRKRESGSIIFIVIRDSTGIMQCAVKKDSVDEKSWSFARDSSIESSIEVSGTCREEKRAPTGYEIEVRKFKQCRSRSRIP